MHQVLRTVLQKRAMRYGRKNDEDAGATTVEAEGKRWTIGEVREPFEEEGDLGCRIPAPRKMVVDDQALAPGEEWRDFFRKDIGISLPTTLCQSRGSDTVVRVEKDEIAGSSGGEGILQPGNPSLFEE